MSKHTYSKDLKNYGEYRKEYDACDRLEPSCAPDNNVYYDDEDTRHYLDELDRFLDKETSIELMNDEEQHCIDWIRSGHSFYANEFNMKDNNGRPMNIAESTFMQRLIIEAYKNGLRNNYFEADYTNIQKRDPHTDELTEEDQSYVVIDFYDFEKYKKDHPVTPREEGACIKWINDGQWFFTNPLYKLDGMFFLYSASFLEAYRFYNQAVERYKKRLAYHQAHL